MSNQLENQTIPTPQLRERKTGGWLAVSPKWARFSIGVVGQTKEEAASAFRLEFARWVSFVDGTVQKSLDVPK
jgi:hypothetical protein